MRLLKKAALLVILVSLAATTALFSQVQKVLEVSYLIGQAEFTMDEQSWTPLKINDKVPENAIIRVIGAEDMIELEFPGGTATVSLKGRTSVRVMNIMKASQTKKNENIINLMVGKIFAKVKKNQDQEFKVETQTSVAAVRGTMFGMSFSPGGGGKIVVTEGTVAMLDPAGILAPVLINQGFMSVLPSKQGDAVAPPQQATAGDIKEFDESYAGGSSADQSSSSQASSAGAVSSQASRVGVPDNIPNNSGGNTGGASSAPSGGTGGSNSGGGCNQQGLNWSISSENIGNLVWNKVLLSPVLKLDKFTIGFYLTVYFRTLEDVFEISKWYNYGEWNFGTSTNTNAPYDWLDLAHDILLKIRFAQYEDKMILFALGSIPSMTLGHGSLINNYANDLMFPSQRVIGLNFGLDLGVWGFQTLIDDIFRDKVIGLRTYVRPLFGSNAPPLFGNLGIGVSGFIDLEPNLSNTTNKAWGYAVDLDLPLMDLLGIFKMTLYADAATLGYVYDTNINYMRGLGVFAGLKGTIIVVDYRAEYRYLNGGFIPNYIDKFYDVNKSSKLGLLVNPTNTVDSHGFFIEGGKQWEGIGGLEISYQEYFNTNTWPNPGQTNHFNMLHLGVRVDKCLFKKAYGSIEYDKNNFDYADLVNYNTFMNNSVVTIKLFYEISDGAYVGLNYKRFYTLTAGVLQESQTFGLETQLGM